jgi:peptidoglycan/LPS O-acetylase OafA/YrhL
MLLDGWVHSLPTAGQAILRGGYLAVGSFFVLSGFVIALRYGSNTWNSKSLIRYGVGRFARLYPTYLLTLLVISPFVFDYLFRPAPAFSEKAAQVTIYGLALQGWSRPAVYWNTPAWSLTCELFFYLCFPLIAICLRGSRLKILPVVLVSLALPKLLARAGMPADWKPMYHLADFLLGIAAAGIYEMLAKSRTLWLRYGIWLYAPAIAIGAILVVSGESISHSMNLNTLMRPVNAALIVGLALGGGFPARVLSTRLAMHLGEASYSMYILHVPLLWWYKRSWLNGSGYLTPTMSAVVYLVWVVILSTIVCRLVEVPANRRIREWVRGPRFFAGWQTRPGAVAARAGS